jgi:membrane-bound serine protease (ClpP class)
MLMNTGVPGYGVNLGVIAGIAVCAALLLALILWLVMRARRSHAVTGDVAMLADVAELLEPVNADGEAWVMVRGERWRVHCDTSLPAGARVRIVRRQGLLLWVVPA